MGSISQVVVKQPESNPRWSTDVREQLSNGDRHWQSDRDKNMLDLTSSAFWTAPSEVQNLSGEKGKLGVSPCGVHSQKIVKAGAMPQLLFQLYNPWDIKKKGKLNDN
jgi:hypothetical protein